MNAFVNTAAICVLTAVLPSPAQAQDASAPSCARHHAGVNERGDSVMGFDHEKTTHHFRLTRLGGSIEVTVNDPEDTGSRDAIRGHLAHIARMFSEGNFEAPMLIHDRVPPGASTMKKKKGSIGWKFQQTEAGGRIVIITKDAEALSAIHEFLRFQIEDHQTGDPVRVAEEPESKN
jgi:hypothetical protein